LTVKALFLRKVFIGEIELKLITYRYQGETAVGVVINEQSIVSLKNIAGSMLSFIEGGDENLARANDLVARAQATIPIKDIHLLAPIPHPRRNIMCLGKNYAEHAIESNQAWGDKVEIPEYPVVFTKSTASANGPYDDIPYDAEVSQAIDFEAELLLIIGKPGVNIRRDQAMDHVYGYSVINDATARDLQRQHKQFFKGKSLDGHAPMGPWIVTASEIPDPHNLDVKCEVNGVEKQNGNTRQMIFDIPETIAQLSRGMRLLPGDLIATGTPSGVGFARNPPEFLKPGDVVTCTVEGIGSIRNKIAVR
jgi:2-keto-4-pentenoate hydratase/2-oxohepta-3-ene-1,7-dioic acid hydratase in catechol pathway